MCAGVGQTREFVFSFSENVSQNLDYNLFKVILLTIMSLYSKLLMAIKLKLYKRVLVHIKARVDKLLCLAEIVVQILSTCCCPFVVVTP